MCRYLVWFLLASCATQVPPSGGDDDTDDPPKDTIRALVLRNGAPASGVTVAFHDAAGALLETGTTGADGIAEGTGSAITAPRGDSDLATVTGVRGGETIVFGLRAEAISDDTATTLRVAATPVLNAASYTVDVGCRSIAVPAMSPAPQLPVGTACAPSGMTTVISASRTADGTPWSWAAATDVAIVGGGTTDVTLSAWSAAWNGLQIISLDLPARSIGIEGRASAVHRDIPFRGLSVPNRVTAYPEASATMIVGYPLFGHGTEYAVQLVLGDDGVVSGTSAIVGRLAGHPDVLTLDANAYMAAIPGVTADAKHATWQAGQPADAALVIFTGPSSRWVVMTPPSAGAVTLPALPPELAARVPAQVTTTDVALIDDDQLADYDAARVDAGVTLLERPLRGAAARVRYVIERVSL